MLEQQHQLTGNRRVAFSAAASLSLAVCLACGRATAGSSSPSTTRCLSSSSLHAASLLLNETAHEACWRPEWTVAKLCHGDGLICGEEATCSSNGGAWGKGLLRVRGGSTAGLQHDAWRKSQSAPASSESSAGMDDYVYGVEPLRHEVNMS